MLDPVKVVVSAHDALEKIRNIGFLTEGWWVETGEIAGVGHNPDGVGLACGSEGGCGGEGGRRQSVL